MADTRLFTQQFNGTPAAQLTIVQPSGTTEYLPYGEDKTVYIGSSDTLLSVTSDEITADTGAIFGKVWAVLKSRHYPVIGIDSSQKVFTFTGQDVTTSAGKTTGKYYFISQEDGKTEYLEVSDTGCTFTESSGVPVIEVEESAITDGTSHLYQKVSPYGGQCTIAVTVKFNQGKSTRIEYFGLDSYSTAVLPPTYTFRSQSRWLDVNAAGDTLSSIATTQEVVYIEWNSLSSDAEAVRAAIIAALDEGALPVVYTSSHGILSYYYPLQRFSESVVMECVNGNIARVVKFNSDGTAETQTIPLGGSAYTARSPLHISDSDEIYMDPVGASPLSNISTPSLDVLSSTASAAMGGGHGNGWCSLDGHLFSIPNYFAPETTDYFEYIVTQAQPASAVYTHYIAIYELDEENKQLHLCALSQNAAALDSTPGLVKVNVEYIDDDYGTIKPDRLYYACHICDQSAVLVAGLTGNTFNLNPNSATQPIGITKANVCSVDSDGNIDVTTIKTLSLTDFGMLAERHFVGLKHQV